MYVYVYVLPGWFRRGTQRELPLPHMNGAGLGSQVGPKGKQAIYIVVTVAAYLSDF